LSTVADGEDGLVEVEGVLEEKLVNSGAGRVGRGALGEGVLAVSLRVNIEVAAGQKDTLHAG
jgi:Flp pilus assembly protein CpaB